MKPPPVHLLATFALGWVVTGPAAADLTEEEHDFFESRIRPLLVENCYECHSASTKRKGGLLLDRKAGWLQGGDSGSPIIPGNPGKSLLFRAVSYLEPDFQMPPKNRLRQDQIEDLERWIAMGAPDPRGEAASAIETSFDIEALKAKHWAWKPVTDPPLPPVENPFWARSAVDRFLLAKLEARGLRPADEASPGSLIRRLTFDLIGLPPSPDEVRAFIASSSESSYERLVDRLLASPHFGERWGQHWLDLMRYAETWGHEQDFPIPEAWRYRDYVVCAFNADVPYDALLIEHIAGDLLTDPRIDPVQRTNESILGTGFWHLGEATHSPVDIREDECLRTANQIDVFSKAFLGLTVACARCHDHKFDAIPTADYYALFGYLQSSNYYIADVSDPECHRDVFTELQKLLSTLRSALRVPLARLDLDLRPPANSMSSDDPLYVTTRSTPQTSFRDASDETLAVWEAESTASVRAQANQTVVRSEKHGERNYTKRLLSFDPDRDVVIDYSTASTTPWIAAGWRFGTEPAPPGSLLIADEQTPWRGFTTERAAHADLISERFTGLLRTPTFEVSSDTIWFRFRGRARAFVEVDSHRVCEGPLHSNALRLQLDGDNHYRWVSHDLHKYLGHRVHVEFTPESGFSLSSVRFSAEEPKDPFYVNPIIEKLVADREIRSVEEYLDALEKACRRAVERSLEGEADPAAAELAQWAFRRFLRRGPAWDDVVETIEKFRRARARLAARLPKPVPALTLMDGSGENEPVHIRGNHRTLAPEPVPRAFLTALRDGAESAAPVKGSGRLDLARQAAAASNPFTSRVYVNRVWHHIFGRGIVPSVDNFGATGQKPSHPDLLDHLATTFVNEDRWSTKRLVRRLVSSSAYRMSSQPDPAAEKVDPTNALLHRMPLRRLTAEAIRDNMLSVSGRLDPRLCGPSIPVHISDFMRNDRSPGSSGPLDGDGRRSIYIEARRNQPEPLLIAFDKPTPFTAIGRRNVSNSPAQPLMMLNNELVHELARSWARRLLEREGIADHRIEQAYMEAFARPPEAWECEAAISFVGEQAKRYAEESTLRAWADLLHTLFNVKEFLFLN